MQFEFSLEILTEKVVAKNRAPRIRDNKVSPVVTSIYPVPAPAFLGMSLVPNVALTEVRKFYSAKTFLRGPVLWLYILSHKLSFRLHNTQRTLEHSSGTFTTANLNTAR